MNSYDEHGITQTVDFAYGEVDGEQDEGPHLDADIELLRRVWEWAWDIEAIDKEGFFDRCVIICWVFCTRLRDNTETQMAHRVGKKKQSLDRQFRSFKREFPELRKHLKQMNRT